MEVLYHIRPYFVGIFPYIALIYGKYLQFRFLKWPTRPGKRLQKTNWKDPPFLMGKSTISMAMFNTYVKLPTMLVVDLPL